MKPTVYWFNGCRGSWCHAIVEWLTADCNHGPRRDGDDKTPAVIVFKADSADVTKLNEFLGTFETVLVFMTANEDGAFDPAKLQHPRMRLWIQTPTLNQQQWCSAAIPWGWTPGFDGTRWQSRLPGYEATEADRMLDFSFVGQNTHDRRKRCIEALEQYAGPQNCILTSHGFARGLPRHLYFELLVNSKFVICPSGPRTVDTFRIWEALEAGAVPIVDTLSTRDHGREYWEFIAGPDHPLVLIDNWGDEVGPALDHLLKNWDAVQSMTLDWWANRKEFWKKKFATDLEMLTTR